MVSIPRLTDEEKYLLAILTSQTGIDLAEFVFVDPTSDSGRYRVRDYQWSMASCLDKRQILASGRNVGKSESIKMRAAAMPFALPGRGMLITAPELNHLKPLTDAVNQVFTENRIIREMLPDNKSAGIGLRPHWQARFKNGTAVTSRLPNVDGRGLKGCLGADVLVSTGSGQIPIQDVKVGDWVLTHKGRYRPVDAVHVFEEADDLVTMVGGGQKGMVVSRSHAFLGRYNAKPKAARNLDAPAWVDVADPDILNWYIGTPNRWPHETTPDFFADENMLRLAGAYVADGNMAKDGRTGLYRGICITDSPEGADRVASWVQAAGLNSRFQVRQNKSVRVDIAGRDLANHIVDNFNQLSDGKRIPPWLLGAQREYREAFLDGYLAGDGTWDEEKQRWTASTASKELAVGLKILGQSLGYGCSLGWHDPDVTHIMGVKLKAKPKRSYRIIFSDMSQTAIADEGISWTKIRRIDPAERQTVYDLTVRDDHSYVADSLVCHNQHVTCIEMDESQNANESTWVEIVETLNAGEPEAIWRCSGVSTGARDSFYEKSQPGSGWTVHKLMAMMRPTWSDDERQAKIVEYGGSRQSIDYIRNIYGDHGDASSNFFVSFRLLNCVDTNSASGYNTDVYKLIRIEDERFPNGASDDDRAALIENWITVPDTHLSGYSQTVAGREVGSPRGYAKYYGGGDIGITSSPTELLVFGQRVASDFLELLLRVQLLRVKVDDQQQIIKRLFQIYGDTFSIGIDKNGPGEGLVQPLERWSEQLHGTKRVWGFKGPELRIYAIEDRPLEAGEKPEDLIKKRPFLEASMDWLRNNHVDARKFRLPYDTEVIRNFQGQTVTTVKDPGSPYGIRRQFNGAGLHALDAVRQAIGAMYVPPLEEALIQKPERAPVIPVFMGQW